MAAEIERARPGAIVELLAGGRGDFIVVVYAPDGSRRELWNKNASGLGFPEPSAIVALL